MRPGTSLTIHKDMLVAICDETTGRLDAWTTGRLDDWTPGQVKMRVIIMEISFVSQSQACLGIL